MRHSFLDQYSDRDSVIHRLDPRSKLVVTLAFIATVVLTPPGSWLAYGLFFGIIATLVTLSRLPPSHFLKRSLVIIPFVLLVAVFIPFFKSGEVADSYNLWLWQVSVTYSGLHVLLNIIAKAWLSILSLILLTSTTSFSGILGGLEKLKMPGVMVMIMSFMYRYIFLLTDEVMRMKQARDSRNFGGGKRLWRIGTVGSMIGTLFIRSYERGERVYASMVARGFDGHSRTLKRLYFCRKDAIFIAVLLVSLVSASIISLII
jgi:cobalt/nickel transport system permease protein